MRPSASARADCVAQTLATLVAAVLGTSLVLVPWSVAAQSDPEPGVDQSEPAADQPAPVESEGSDTNGPLGPATQGDGEENSDHGDTGRESATVAGPAATPSEPADNFPRDPAARVERAEEAFRNSDYEVLRPLLEPLFESGQTVEPPALEVRARKLLGLALYFEAQQVTDADRRRLLLDSAEEQFLELLRKEPDESLNPLLYPASVVELFEAVKKEHAAELDELRAERDESPNGSADQGLQTVYIEREVIRRNYAVNFFPFGLGQFQNGEAFKGTFFASTQVAALGLNVASYWMIESLRGADGFFEPGTGQAADQARQWRITQYVGIGVFAGLYAWSIIDALLDYRGAEVDIRTLDEPPPELSAGEADDKGATFQIGWGSFGVSWY